MKNRKVLLRLASVTMLAMLLVSCASAPSRPVVPDGGVTPITEIAGVRLGMSRDDVRTTLANIAGLAREERRRHEVWTLAGDPRFESLIIGYTKEWNVRFVTAVARRDGVAVPYGAVLDLERATHREAGPTHTWTWAVGDPVYSVIAIGGPAQLTYLSIEEGQ